MAPLHPGTARYRHPGCCSEHGGNDPEQCSARRSQDRCAGTRRGLVGWDAIKIGTASKVGPNGEWLATTGANGELLFPLVAGAGILLLMGVVILVGTGKRRRAATSGLALS